MPEEENRKPTIFVSYRRDDSGGYAGRLYDWLSHHFGDDHTIFMDVAGINPGEGWREVIEDRIKSCDIALAVIGPRWLYVTGEHGRRRLDDPSDILRLEMRLSLSSHSIRTIIPVLVGGAEMPSINGLPDDIRELANYQAFKLLDGTFREDVTRLAEILLHQFRVQQNTTSGREFQSQIFANWPRKKLGEIADIKLGVKYIEQPELVVDGFPYYTSKGFSGFVRDYTLHGRAILISTLFQLAKYHSMFRVNGRVAVGNQLLVIQPQEDQILFDFLWFFLSVVNFKDYASVLGDRAARITSKIVGDIDVPIPPISQQQAIVNYLTEKQTSLETEKIELQQRLNNLENIWDDALRNAFSGEIH